MLENTNLDKDLIKDLRSLVNYRSAFARLLRLKEPWTVPYLIQEYQRRNNLSPERNEILYVLKLIGTDEAMDFLAKCPPGARSEDRYEYIDRSGQKKELVVSWNQEMLERHILPPSSDLDLSVDGRSIGFVKTKKEIIEGKEFALPDGSKLKLEVKEEARVLQVAQNYLSLFAGCLALSRDGIPLQSKRLEGKKISKPVWLILGGVGLALIILLFIIGLARLAWLVMFALCLLLFMLFMIQMISRAVSNPDLYHYFKGTIRCIYTKGNTVETIGLRTIKYESSTFFKTPFIAMAPIEEVVCSHCGQKLIVEWYPSPNPGPSSPMNPNANLPVAVTRSIDGANTNEHVVAPGDQ